jgi:hypothetical protein
MVRLGGDDVLQLMAEHSLSVQGINGCAFLGDVDRAAQWILDRFIIAGYTHPRYMYKILKHSVHTAHRLRNLSANFLILTN